MRSSGLNADPDNPSCAKPVTPNGSRTWTALARGDAGVLALWVDADDRERIFEQVGNDRADALAGAGGCDRQQMRRTGIAHRLAGLHVAADQQAVIVVQGLRLTGGGEAGRAVRVAGIGIVEPAEQGQDEHPDHDERHGKVDADETELGERAVLVELEIPDRQHQQEEQRGEQHHREQDHDDDVAGEPEGCEQHAEQRPHRVGAGGAGKIMGGAREAHLADRQHRIGVGMAEQLEDDLRGEGRGNRLVAQHIEQPNLVGFERQALDREIGARVRVVVAPHRDFGGRAAHEIERADLPADRLDIELRHGAFSPEGKALIPR